MKIAPLYHALSKEDWADPQIVHTGQHYDFDMSDSFFRDLQLPDPTYHLGAGGGSHGEQTAEIIKKYEALCLENPPGLVIVVGDVNSTMGCAISAKKLCLPVAHLEAGLRSGDRTMPEEINRLITDSISDYLWTPSPDADAHLLASGVDKDSICLVGNIMIDAYEMLSGSIASYDLVEQLGLSSQDYGLVTLHRPSNVDDRDKLGALVDGLLEASKSLPLVFSVHPRTRERLVTFGLMKKLEDEARIELLGPQNYIGFMNLVMNSRAVITDSGGIQEETTYLGIPCLTLRDNTERPITIDRGTNTLVSVDTFLEKLKAVLASPMPGRLQIENWDGNTASRVVDCIRKIAKSI